MEQLENALIINEKYQKQFRKQRRTKPELFVMIETFMIRKKLIGYGGMAINSLLPKDKQFYDEDDVPDYDLFSPNAISDSIELANTISHQFTDIEVKSGLNEGTYKIFVNFIPIVDLTNLDKDLFRNLSNNAVKVNGLLYAPYNCLRMSMYLELSRPLGDLTRWEKVYHRLELLNQSHPLLVRHCNIKEDSKVNDDLFQDVLKRVSDFPLLGDYAVTYYQHLFPKRYQGVESHTIYIQSDKETIPDVWKSLQGLRYTRRFHSNHFLSLYEIHIEGEPMLYVVLSNSCQSYNMIGKYKVATLDTLLSVFYAISFMNIESINRNRVLSFCYLLHNCKNTKDAVLKRFGLPCYGSQNTYEDLRQMRDKKFKVFRKTGAYRKLFFKYHPKTRKHK